MRLVRQEEEDMLSDCVIYRVKACAWGNITGGFEPRLKNDVWWLHDKFMHWEVSICEYATTHLGQAKG